MRLFYQPAVEIFGPPVFVIFPSLGRLVFSIFYPQSVSAFSVNYPCFH